MAHFIAKAADLKKAVSTAALATSDATDTIKGHILFSAINGMLMLQATDDDSISYTTTAIEDLSDKCSFTAEPKNILELLKDSDTEKVRFDYDSDTKTLNVYVSDDTESYVSFPSFDPAEFLSFNEHLKAMQEVDKISTSVLSTGLKFIEGFVSQDKKSQKYANSFISEGIIYGSNGSNRVGAFKADDLAKIFKLTIRSQMVGPVLEFINSVAQDQISFKESEKMVLFTATDSSSGFGFRKSTVEMPKMPISLEVPAMDGIYVNRKELIKKVNRVSVALRGEVKGIEMMVYGDTLNINTVADRKSVERIACKRITGTDPMHFILDCGMLKKALSQFLAPQIDIYSSTKAKKCFLYNAGELVIGDDKDPIKKPFISVCLLGVARTV